jgi:hypothetical protein
MAAEDSGRQGLGGFLVVRPWKGKIRSISSRKGIAASSVVRHPVGVSSAVVGILSAEAHGLFSLLCSLLCALLGTDRDPPSPSFVSFVAYSSQDLDALPWPSPTLSLEGLLHAS